jgi:hypothetical protein
VLLHVVAQFSAHTDPNTLKEKMERNMKNTHNFLTLHSKRRSGKFPCSFHRFPPGIPLFLNFPELFLSHHFTQQKREISWISVGNFRYMSFFQVLSPPISNVLRDHLFREVVGRFPSNFLCSLSHLLTKIS